MYEIDEAIPAPPLPGSGARAAAYPIDALAIGHSFLVAAAEAGAVRQALGKKKERTPGWNYTSKKVPGGVRVWRVA